MSKSFSIPKVLCSNMILCFLTGVAIPFMSENVEPGASWEGHLLEEDDSLTWVIITSIERFQAIRLLF